MKLDWRTILIFLLVLAPVLLFAGLLAQYGVNVPHWDDHAIRIFVDKYGEQANFFDKISTVFAYHNEHRIGLTRVFALLIYETKGFLDFKTLQVLGFLGLLGFWWILILVTRKLKLPIWSGVIISLCVFNFSLFENLLWGMASVQNFWIVFLGLSSCYHLSFVAKKENFSFIIALIFSIVAVFTSGNGVMIPVIGLVLLLIQKKWQQAGIWVLVSVFFLALYFQGYSEIPSKRWIIETETIKAFFASVASFIYSDGDPRILTNNGLAITGGFLVFASVLIFALTVFNWATKSKRLQNTPGLIFLIGSAMFVFGTLAIVSLTRSDEGIALILSGKYKIYSFLALTLLFIYGIRLIPKALQYKTSALFALISLLVWSLSYIGYFKYFESSQMDRLTFALDNYRNVKADVTSYKAPMEIGSVHLDFSDAREDDSLVDSLKVMDDRILIWEKQASQNLEFAVFKSDSAVFFAGMKSIPSENLAKQLVQYYEDSKLGELNLLSFPSDLYEIYYYYLDTGELVNTGKILRIKGKPYEEAPKNW